MEILEKYGPNIQGRSSWYPNLETYVTPASREKSQGENDSPKIKKVLEDDLFPSKVVIFRFHVFSCWFSRKILKNGMISKKFQKSCPGAE